MGGRRHLETIRRTRRWTVHVQESGNLGWHEIARRVCEKSRIRRDVHSILQPLKVTHPLPTLLISVVRNFLQKKKMEFCQLMLTIDVFSTQHWFRWENIQALKCWQTLEWFRICSETTSQRCTAWRRRGNSTHQTVPKRSQDPFQILIRYFLDIS